MKIITPLLVLFFISNSFALEIQPEVEKEYLAQGGSPLALAHVKCFLQNYSQTDFNLRSANLSERCNGMSDESRTIQMNSFDYVTIIDYTMPSSQRRLFIVDLENPQPPYVEAFYVSHGRYKNTPRTNTVPGVGKNTIEWLTYYSNVKRSNATSSGFYITGHQYKGKWSGPNKDKFSLIVHGINKDENDNACDRAVVLHGNGHIQESGAKEGVGLMSSGCFMVDLAYVNAVIDKIRGGGGNYHKNEDRLGGTLFFAYGTNQAAQDSSYYCSSVSEDSLRIN